MGKSQFKQHNKPFKTNKRPQNLPASRQFKGVAVKEREGSKAALVNTKIERRNKAQQKMKIQRQKQLQKTRHYGQQGASKLVVFLSLHESASSVSTIEALISQSDIVYQTSPVVKHGSLHLVYWKATKQFFTFVSADPNSLASVVDLIAVADFICFVTSVEQINPRDIDLSKTPLIHPYGEILLKTTAGMGMPSPFFLALGTSSLSFPQFSKVKKQVQTFAEDRIFVDCRALFDRDVNEIMGSLSQAIPREISWHSERPSLLAIGAQMILPDGGVQDPLQPVYLDITGEVRNSSFSANQLITFPDLGDFEVEHIVSHTNLGGYIEQPHAHTTQTQTPASYAQTILSQSIPLDHHCDICGEDLIAFALPEPNEEQSFPPEPNQLVLTDEQKRLQKINVPKGTTSYQASWITAMGDAEEDEEEEMDEEEKMLKETEDAEWDPSQFSRTNDTASAPDAVPIGLVDAEVDESHPDFHKPDADETQSVLDVILEEEKKTAEERMQLVQQARQEKEFSDEIDTPLDQPAKERFLKYRGVRSFASSPWNPKEDLPADYNRIFQFASFTHIARECLREPDQWKAVDEKVRSEGMAGGEDPLQLVQRIHTHEVNNVIRPFPAKEGDLVTIRVRGIPASISQALLSQCFPQHDAPSLSPLVIFGLLRHEHKVSVLNVTLSLQTPFGTTPTPTTPVVFKSKAEYVFQVGARRFRCHPLFSTPTVRITQAPKSKYIKEIALTAANKPHTTVASIYAPVTLGNDPVLSFVENRQDGASSLVFCGAGSVHSINPDRLIIKRIILTGYPLKIRKRLAVIRYMFFNPDDIFWFKPVDLWTKNGRSGRIKEPLGTHGYFKGIFDAPLNQGDTVCMSLYRRIYPKSNSTRYRGLPSTGERQLE